MIAIIKIIFILASTIVLLIPQIFVVYFIRSISHLIPILYHRVVCCIAGIRIEVRGKPNLINKTLYISNHCSYLDIVILGSILPACFVSKSEVSNWPFFGLLARLQRTIFIDREAIRSTVEQINVLSDRLLSGDSLVLFPEGSSTDGTAVLPFKSCLFHIISQQPTDSEILIQPITIAYTHVNGRRIDQKTRSKVCWFGSASFVGHLWSFLNLLNANIIVNFHDPVKRSLFKNRKDTAIFCHKKISNALNKINSDLVP